MREEFIMCPKCGSGNLIEYEGKWECVNCRYGFTLSSKAEKPTAAFVLSLLGGIITLFTNPEYKYETELVVYPYVAIGIETVEENPEIPEYDRSVTEPPYIVQRHPALSSCKIMVYAARQKGYADLYVVGLKVSASKPLRHIGIVATIYNCDSQYPRLVVNPVARGSGSNVQRGWYWSCCWHPIHVSEFPVRIIVSLGIQSEGGAPL